MKAHALLALAMLAACVPEPPPPAAAAGPRPAERSRAAAAGHGPDRGAAGIEEEFERVRGAAAAARVRAAATSVVAAFYQGLPRPITGPDGRVAYAGPAVNAVVREDGRWLGWKTGRAAPVPAGVAARLDALVDDPALWREPDDFPRGACTDAGSLQLVIRRQGRLKLSRQDNCDSRGLAGELGRIVLNEAPSPPG